jgi:hypothetical protein
LEGYELREDGILKYICKIYVPNDQELKNMILSEMHKVPYDGHPSYHKTIVSIKKKYYRPIMKKEVVYFIAQCIEFQKVKAEHKHPVGLIQPLHIPEWKWEVITMGFITNFPRTAKQHELLWWWWTSLLKLPILF